MNRRALLATCVLGPLLNTLPAAGSPTGSRPASQAAGRSLPAVSVHKHTERISGAAAEFTITVNGTADHRRMGGWKEEGTAEHNPTCSLRIANQGNRPVINPRVVVEGGPDWFDIDRIIQAFVRPGMSDEEKTFALWQWVRHNMRGGPTFDGSLWGDGRSMTRFMNAMGTGACGTYHTVMPVIGKQAGLDAYAGCFANCSHAVQKEVYGGQDRYFDAHIPHQNGQPQGWFALKLDNADIAGVNDIMEDRYLIDRAGGGPERFGYVAYFGPGCSFDPLPQRRDPRDMGITLRPAESTMWHWQPAAPAWKPGIDMGPEGLHTTGTVDYAPALTRDNVLRHAETARQVRFAQLDNASPAVSCENDEGELVYRLYCPYPITRARITGELTGPAGERAIELSYSFDGRNYAALAVAGNSLRAAPFTITLSDDPHFREPELTHAVWFRVVLRDERVLLHGLRLSVDFQACRPSLPSLHAGNNVIRFVSDGFGVAENLSVAVAEAAALGLVNGGFEDGSDHEPAPAGWTVFGRTDGRHVGKWFAGTTPAQGRAIFGAGASWDIKDGGIYQKLRWPANRRANAAVYVSTNGDSTASSGCRIGLDPTGGTDADAPDIVWSPLTRSERWKRIETGPVTAAADGGITVFLQHRHASDGDRFNVTGFDACTIEDADAPRGDVKDVQPSDLIVVEYEYHDLPDLPVPKAPDRPLHPPDGGRFGFNEPLRWPRATIDGGRIAEHELYISARKDLAWPVMPNTHRIVRSAETTFSLVFPDVLRHGATYYWRVRGRSTDGVWGEWSPVWSFVAAGPNAPRDLAASYDAHTGRTTLSWQPPQGGTGVSHYELYASGEPGFSPIRETQQCEVLGNVVERRANLLATTPETGFDVSGRSEVFYRVTAIDAEGNRSAPTPIVKLPSPALLPAELPPAVAGRPYSAKLPARLRTGRYAWSLREGLIIDRADSPTFALVDDTHPDWLSIDARTGELRGIPPAAAVGACTLTVRLEDGRGGRCIRTCPLRVLSGS